MIRMSARLQMLRRVWAAMQKNPPQHHQACVKQCLASTMRDVRQALLQLQLELQHLECSHGMVPLSSLPPLTLSPVTTQGHPYGSAAWETPSQQSESELHGLSAAYQHAGPPQLPETPSFPPMFPDGAFE
jgi:hypothetical protein